MVEVKLHDVGEGMTEGEITQYLVNVGDQVKIDQPLVEVQTDKVSAELPSPVAGTVKEILAEVGEVVTVGTTVIVLEKEGAAALPHESKASQEKEEPVSFTMKINKGRAERQSERVLATPYTRRIALENKVDIEQVSGTGPAGRVTDEDVIRFMKEGPTKTAEETSHEEAPQAREPVSEKKEEAAPVRAGKTIPYRGRRKQIGKKMTHSLMTIPHVTHFDEVDVTNVMKLREELKAEGIKPVSVASFFIKALVFALKEYPVFNAVLDEEKEEIVLKEEYNIGLAADTDEGLIVPVVQGADRLSITAINDEMKRVMQLAKENKLSKKDLTGGTFTVSNVGPLGSTGATPIINHPEVALVAFHKTKKMPVVVNDEIVIRQMMNMSMSFDHRVADGATAVAFTSRFAELIENPTKMMLEMM
ncbi:2-oxo acid dehydrogenase subunit E2 [Bacillus sp. H-16]|uniref:dihydrolipoamide acetyltransferase family protein n=1 Tax=Alteribacter salitolerans TaxID=2912333 RepID=UPI0019643846|nr:dihydrolipoamide acetyltransferase family protein [Alteribacter salitolerans]MBM7095927.1 2-oxo acid dehydrogenase subunit E2 [Alteribacter salitolerans]